MVKDIVERASKPPSAPSAPQAPAGGSSGFPVAQHRSQRPSAFARSRQQQAARQEGRRALGEGKAVDVVPTVASASSSPAATVAAEDLKSDAKLSEADEVRRSVEAENVRRVEGMTQTEREEEVSELKERFGMGIADLMRKRKEARESNFLPKFSSLKDEVRATESEAGPSTQPRTQSQPKQTLDEVLGDTQKILEEVSEENRQKVDSMSGIEREQEVEELQERFGGQLMEALRKRAETRSGKGKEKDLAMQMKPESEEGKKVRFAPGSQVDSTAVKPAHKASPRESVPSQTNDPSLADLKAYFPSVSSESSKLAWLQPLPTSSPSSSTAVRFDLSGNVLSTSAQIALPQHLGLHHHGSMPDLAGYTINDILYLCRSTVPSQRITMMGLLAKIIVRLREGELGEEAKKEYDELEMTRRAIEMGVEILAGLTRGVGVIETGIDLLFEALAGPTWTWPDGGNQIDIGLQFIADDEKTGVSAIPFEDVIPRMTELISIEDGLSPSTIQQLLMILRRATLISKDLCETICPIIPTVIRQLVVQRVWPPTSTSTLTASVPSRARYPSLDALRLLRDLTTSSRACAEEILGLGVYETTLRFIVTATWESEGLELPATRHGQSLALETLRTYSTLGRYGLSASIVTSSSEIWRLLGSWVEQISLRESVAAQSLEQGIVEAYFECLGIWITCAVDPHRTTPEHSLTWAQVAAMKWDEEAIGQVRAVAKRTGTGRRESLVAALDMLGLWIRGAKVNGVKGGEEEKAVVFAGLKETGLGEVVSELLKKDTIFEGVEERLLTSAVQLHQLLHPAGELLDLATIDELCQRYTLQESDSPSRATTYLRYHLLQLIIESSPSPSTWLSTALNLFLDFQIGDEPLALDLLDSILKSDLTSVLPQLESLSHPDKLQLVRPLLQYTILPDVESVVAPCQPSHLYLKATSSLRSSPSRTSEGKPALPGLPLRRDWFFSPIDELLRSGTSDALAQTPPDWQATEVEIVLATLLLASLAYSKEKVVSKGSDRSRILLGLMKVHMLEHGQTSSMTANEVEVFRDPVVGEVMRGLMALVTAPMTAGDTDNQVINDDPPKVDPSTTSNTTTGSAAPLEMVSIPFLGTGVPFYQFYLDFLALYEAISFSDPLFSQLLLAPLAMCYPADYRRLVWNDHSSILRGIRSDAEKAEVPIEQGVSGRTRKHDLENYFYPFETDVEVLSAYARAMTHGRIDSSRNPFLSELAIHHLSALFWAHTSSNKINSDNTSGAENSSDNKAEEKEGTKVNDGAKQKAPGAEKKAELDSVRIGLLRSIIATGSEALVRQIMEWDLRKCIQGREVAGLTAGRDEMEKRKKIVRDLAGERGVKRLEVLRI